MMSLRDGGFGLGAAPVCQADFDRLASAADDHEVEVSVGVVHCLVFCPGWDKGKIAGAKLVSFWVFVVPFGLGKHHAVS